MRGGVVGRGGGELGEEGGEGWACSREVVVWEGELVSGMDVGMSGEATIGGRASRPPIEERRRDFLPLLPLLLLLLSLPKGRAGSATQAKPPNIVLMGVLVMGVLLEEVVAVLPLLGEVVAMLPEPFSLS